MDLQTDDSSTLKYINNFCKGEVAKGIILVLTIRKG